VLHGNLAIAARLEACLPPPFLRALDLELFTNPFFRWIFARLWKFKIGNRTESGEFKKNLDNFFAFMVMARP